MNWPSPGNDPWYAANPTEGLARRTYYNVNATPTHLVDGVAATGTQAGITAAYNARRAIPSHIWFNILPSSNATGDSIICTVRAVADSAYATNVRLRMAIVEIHEHWATPAPNGQTDFPYPFIDFAPDATGQLFTHSGITTDTVTYRAAFPLRTTGPEPYTLDNCAFVVIAQNETTKEIQQAMYRKFSTLFYPNGAETLYVGDTVMVRWDSTAFTRNIQIDINREYPTGGWSAITDNSVNSGTYQWIVTGPVTTTARVRIYPTGDTTAGDMSKTDFSIATPTSITITPNPITVQVPEGDTLRVPITINNTGAMDYIGSLLTATGEGDYQIAQSIDPGGPPASWIDTTGSITGAMGNDVTTGPYQLPFAFPFYGREYSQFWMCSNGWITFNQTTSVDWRNAALPSANFLTMIAIFWDDLVVAPDTGRTTILNDTANHRVVISFVNARRWISPQTHIYAQAALYENGRIEFNYGQVVTTDFTTTIGIQNETRTSAYTFYNNVPIPQNNSIHCVFDPVWATPSNTTFTVPAGQSSTISALFDTRSFQSGDQFNGAWRFMGNIIATTVPFSMSVTTTGLTETNEMPNGFALQAVYPNPFNSQLSIHYALHNVTNVRIALYNVNGQEVYTNLYGDMAAGFHTAKIDAALLATGSYFLKVEAGANHAVKKVVLLK